jgi:hypothetical protein
LLSQARTSSVADLLRTSSIANALLERILGITR